MLFRSVPAVALVVALFWYKRHRIDRDELQWNDSGGTAKSSRVKKTISDDTKKVDSGVQKETNEDSSTNCCTRQEEPPTCVSRKVSESMDIPSKNSTSQSPFCSSQIRHMDEIICDTAVELGSNPNASYFEMIATSCKSFNKNVDKVTRIRQNIANEKNQTLDCETQPFEQNGTDKCNYKEDGQQSEGHTINTQGQEVDERDSANHSPVSVVLDGSVTDEAESEGSNTDSGKGISSIY